MSPIHTMDADPKENLFVVMMTALRYRNEMQNPLKSNLLQHVYACIDDDPQDTGDASSPS